jgi:Protein of unknown function (DUF2812)
MDIHAKTRLFPRFYLDHDKEEAWLNEMADRGWNLFRRGWSGYRFQRSDPGEYIYRVRLLPDWATGDKRHEYFDLMWDSGVEVVCKAGRWSYFRRKAAEGPFELSSDLDSLTRRSSRIAWSFAIGALVLLPVSLRLLDHDMTQRFEWAGTAGIVLLGITAVLGYYAFQAFGRVRMFALRKQAGQK